MQTEIDSSDPAGELVHETEPMDREERQVEALQRMYGRVLEDEERLGGHDVEEDRRRAAR